MKQEHESNVDYSKDKSEPHKHILCEVCKSKEHKTKDHKNSTKKIVDKHNKEHRKGAIKKAMEKAK